MTDQLDDVALDDADLLDLACPGCNADLLVDETYARYRVCGTCNRHFWISARERVALIQQAGTFAELDYVEPVVDAVEQRERQTVADRLHASIDRSALADAVVAGTWTAGATSSVVIVLDPVLLAGGLGIVTADKVGNAIRTATDRHLPVIIFCAGGSRPQPIGLAGATVGARLSAVIADLHRAAQPLISVLAHATGGSLVENIVADADYTLAEPDFETAPAQSIDRIGSRLDQIATLQDLLALLSGATAPPATLTGNKAVHVAIEPSPIGAFVSVDIESNQWLDFASAVALGRGLVLGRRLELPIVLILTGTVALPEGDVRAIREAFLQHLAPVVVVLSGACAPSHLNWVIGDSVMAADDLAIQLPTGASYHAADLRHSGIVDNADSVDLEGQIAAAIGRSMRQSPSRRIDLRIQNMSQRGGETAAISDAARLELLDLSDVQETVRRSMEDWRMKLERREFRMPTFQNLHGIRGFRMPTLSRPDLTDVRERWHAAGAAGGTSRHKLTSLHPSQGRTSDEDQYCAGRFWADRGSGTLARSRRTGMPGNGTLASTFESPVSRRRPVLWRLIRTVWMLKPSNV